MKVISEDSLKIALGFLVMLVLLVAMTLLGLSKMQNIQSKIEVITSENNLKTELMMTIRHGIYEREVSLRNILLLDDPFGRDEGKSRFNQHAIDIVAARNQFATMRLNDREKQLLKEINTAMRRAYYAQVDLIEKSIYYAEEPITRDEIERAFQTQEIFMGKVKQMIALQKTATQKALEDARQSYNQARTSIYILGGAALLVGSLVAILVIRLNESQSRSIREALRKVGEANSQLEERVERRTRQLAQARDEALASSKAKDAFMATMSHELRTPLNIILGYSELLEEIVAEDSQSQYLSDLKKIKNAAQHQLGLINSILDISKIEEGKLDIHPVEFNICELLHDIKEAALPLMTKNQNEFNLNCSNNAGMMYSDDTRIRQILLNLISNAAKFTEQGQVSLNVEVDENEIAFVVEDTGIGIDENYKSQLFKKFSQEDNSTTRRYTGSGLGLSISRHLAVLLKGSISVESEKGKGSKFTLRLPIIYVE